MRRLVWVIAAGALLAAPPPPYEVKRAPRPIQIDGEALEPAWQTAAKMELDASSRASARLLWDDNFVYVMFECDGAAAPGDSVFLRVNPRPAQTDAHIGIEFDASAAVRTFLSGGGYTFGQFRLQGVRLSTYMRENGWTAEAAIPWSNFDDLSRQHGEGVKWTANLGRRGAGAQARPEQFGELVFVK